jgi:hypothetical protein
MLLPLQSLLNVDVHKLRLVVDNPRSPMNPVSFQKNKERCGPARSSSSIKNRWSSISPPPFPVNSLDCVHQDLQGLISSSTTENQKNDKIKIKSSLSMRIPVRLASPVVNNRKQIDRTSPTEENITLRIPVRKASPVVTDRKGLPP